MQSRESILQDNWDSLERSLRNEIGRISLLLDSACQHLEQTSQIEALAEIADGKLNRWFKKRKKEAADHKASVIAKAEAKLAGEREDHVREFRRNEALKKLTSEDKKILGIG